MSNINLLPWRTERITYKNNIFIAICITITATIILFSLTINIFVNVLISQKNKVINNINAKTAFYQSRTKEITGLKERKKLLLSRLSIINNLQAQRTIIVNILQQITISVPTGISFLDINLKDNLLSINGNSESNSRIAEFMRNLEKTKLFSSPRLKEIKSLQNDSNLNNIEFNLEINVVSAKNDRK